MSYIDLVEQRIKLLLKKSEGKALKGEHAGIFFHSALILAAVEFGGFVIGIYIFARES